MTRCFLLLYNLVDTEFDERFLHSLFTTVSRIDSQKLIFQKILGNKRILEGKEILFPFYNGKLVRETFQRVLATLARKDGFGDDLMAIRVEIQNGTTVTGLASRTAQVFESYGYRVASVTNADRNNYEHTSILDRKGDPDAVGKIAELIRCDRIYARLEEEGDQMADVTIILGKDFDGRYVQK